MAKKSVLPYDFAQCRTRLDHIGPYYPEDVIAALYATKANFSEMSSLLGRRRTSIRDYVLANLEVKDVYDEIREGELDRAEKMHTDLALSGDGPALRFILQTLGKDRGYSTRQEQTGKGGGPIETANKSTEGFNFDRYAALLGVVTRGAENGKGVPPTDGAGEQVHSAHPNGETSGVSEPSAS